MSRRRRRPRPDAATAPTPRCSAPPADVRLPDGFAVDLDPRTRRYAAGHALLGGGPIRLLRLSPIAAALLGEDGRLVVRDRTSAALARRLLDTGVAHPQHDHEGDTPPPATGSPRAHDVTVVVPVRDRTGGLGRLLTAVRCTAGGVGVLVVDDGSQDADAVAAVCARHGATVLRHEVAKGPAAARNAGLAAAATPYAALLDSDCAPEAGWLPLLLAHLADPLVAAVAPRIVAAPGATGLLARYEQVASSLDLGPRAGPVAPHGSVPYVPSAALVVRRAALGGGYDESMRVAEDVDLVWRLVAAGWRVRYEPGARVTHEHRTTPWAWARRRAFYGTGAAPLAARHAASVAPVVMSPVSALAWGLLALRRPWGPAAALGVVGWSTYRLSRQLRDLRGHHVLALRLVALGTGYAGRRLCSAAVRHYWPPALVLAAISRPARRLLGLAAVVDGLCGWWPRRADAALLSYLAARRVDDLAYGAGLWWGALRWRRGAALRPASSVGSRGRH